MSELIVTTAHHYWALACQRLFYMRAVNPVMLNMWVLWRQNDLVRKQEHRKLKELELSWHRWSDRAEIAFQIVGCPRILSLLLVTDGESFQCCSCSSRFLPWFPSFSVDSVDSCTLIVTVDLVASLGLRLKITALAELALVFCFQFCAGLLC